VRSYAVRKKPNELDLFCQGQWLLFLRNYAETTQSLVDWEFYLYRVLQGMKRIEKIRDLCYQTKPSWLQYNEVNTDNQLGFVSSER